MWHPSKVIGGNIQDIMKLRKQYGIGSWRKMMGVANICLQSGSTRKAELHWQKENENYVNFFISTKEKRRTS